MLPVMLACVVMVVGVLLVRGVLRPYLEDMPLVLLLCEIAAGAALYLCMLASVGKGLLQDVMRLLRGSGKAEYNKAASLLKPRGGKDD